MAMMLPELEKSIPSNLSERVRGMIRSTDSISKREPEAVIILILGPRLRHGNKPQSSYSQNRTKAVCGLWNILHRKGRNSNRPTPKRVPWAWGFLCGRIWPSIFPHASDVIPFLTRFDFDLSDS